MVNPQGTSNKATYIGVVPHVKTDPQFCPYVNKRQSISVKSEICIAIQ